MKEIAEMLHTCENTCTVYKKINCDSELITCGIHGWYVADICITLDLFTESQI